MLGVGSLSCQAPTEHPLPIYTYKCDANGHEFELRQSFSASPEQACPACGSVSRRRIHAPAVIYKGSGFYTTDYARKSGGASRNGGSSSGDSSAAKDKDDSSATTAKKDSSSAASTSSKSTSDKSTSDKSTNDS